MNAEGRGSPLLGFGCVNLGSVTRGRSWQSDVGLVKAAVAAGVTVFDTASAYGSGTSEMILGHALRDCRQRVRIATKVGYQFSERSLRQQTIRRIVAPALVRLRRSGATPPINVGAYSSQDFSPAAIRRGVEASLRRLQTDYIDVLHLHAPHGVLSEAHSAVQAMIDAGKVCKFGIGAEALPVVTEWLENQDVGVVEIPFGVLDPEAAERVIPLAIARNAEVWVRGVFGGGCLTLAAREVSQRGSTDIQSHPKWPLMAELVEVARGAGVSVHRMAFDFARSAPGVDAVLVGMHSAEHLAEVIEMTRVEPDQELVDMVNGVVADWAGRGESI